MNRLSGGQGKLNLTTLTGCGKTNPDQCLVGPSVTCHTRVLVWLAWLLLVRVLGTVLGWLVWSPLVNLVMVPVAQMPFDLRTLHQ